MTDVTKLAIADFKRALENNWPVLRLQSSTTEIIKQALRQIPQEVGGAKPDYGPAYHRVMELLRAQREPMHGLCHPRERRACSVCNAMDDVNELVDLYQGAPVVVSAPKPEGQREWMPTTDYYDPEKLTADQRAQYERLIGSALIHAKTWATSDKEYMAAKTGAHRAVIGLIKNGLLTPKPTLQAAQHGADDAS